MFICELTAFAPYPKIKKKINEAVDAPNPKIIFDEISIDLEKLPKKNTVSEYTCGFKKVKPKVLITDWKAVSLDFLVYVYWLFVCKAFW